MMNDYGIKCAIDRIRDSLDTLLAAVDRKPDGIDLDAEYDKAVDSARDDLLDTLEDVTGDLLEEIRKRDTRIEELETSVEELENSSASAGTMEEWKGICIGALPASAGLGRQLEIEDELDKIIGGTGA